MEKYSPKEETKLDSLKGEKRRIDKISRSCLNLGSMRVTLEDIQAEISQYNILDEIDKRVHTFECRVPEKSFHSSSLTSRAPTPSKVQSGDWIKKIYLRMSEYILLYKQNSNTVLRHTEEGDAIEEDNKLYEYLTEGKGKFRHKSNALTQTKQSFKKTRSINTTQIDYHSLTSYVSTYDMFDTCQKLKCLKTTFESSDQQSLKKAQEHANEFLSIVTSDKFKLALQVVTRILAGNNYELNQRRFRDMIKTDDPLSIDEQSHYRLRELWRYRFHPTLEQLTSSISSLSWCHNNADILAVGYGIYTYRTSSTPKNGYVCIWNIKNPVNPERCQAYSGIPVTVVEFSPYTPQLLAIGLRDGSVEVRDISYRDLPLVAKSQRRSRSSFEPVTAIQWINEENELYSSKKPTFLALWRNGTVTKYQIITSPYLLGSPLMHINRVDDQIEGLSLPRQTENIIPANRQSQGANLTVNPIRGKSYYILTDQGCVHTCSIYHPDRHKHVFRAHEGTVNSMDFSPFCPRIFLTCGNDWCLRIWLEDLYEPLITLKCGFNPIYCAYWSHSHSTIIVAVTRKTIDIWNIAQSVLKPMVSQAIDSYSFNTAFKFSSSGSSLALGKENGEVIMLAMEDMPFPEHFQYDQLMEAIFSAIEDNTTLRDKVTSLGLFKDVDKKRRCEIRSWFS